MATTTTMTCPSWCTLHAGHDLGVESRVASGGVIWREHTAGETTITDFNGQEFFVELRQLDVLGGTEEPHTEPARVYLDSYSLTATLARETARALVAAAGLLDSSAARPSLTLAVKPFDHSRGVPEHTGHRGVTLDAKTRFQSGRVFSTAFPTVWGTDSGDVEVGDLRIPRDDAAAWFRAVADYLTEGPGAPETVAPAE